MIRISQYYHSNTVLPALRGIRDFICTSNKTGQKFCSFSLCVGSHVLTRFRGKLWVSKTLFSVREPGHAGGHGSREKWEEQREKLLGIRRGNTLQLHTETDGENNMKGIEHRSYKPEVMSSILARALLLGSCITGCQHSIKGLRKPSVVGWGIVEHCQCALEQGCMPDSLWHLFNDLHRPFYSGPPCLPKQKQIVPSLSGWKLARPPLIRLLCPFLNTIFYCHLANAWYLRRGDIFSSHFRPIYWNSASFAQTGSWAYLSRARSYKRQMSTHWSGAVFIISPLPDGAALRT